MPKDTSIFDPQSAAESNWLIFQLDPPSQVGGKWGKRPVQYFGSEFDHESGWQVTGADMAATYDQATAQSYAASLGPNHLIGYLPRPDSAMVIIDLDDCVTQPMPHVYQVDDWARDLLNLEPTYCEISTSGTGLRLVTTRDPDDANHSSGERNGVGLFANGGRAAALTGRIFEGRDTIYPAPSLKAAVLARKGTSEAHSGTTADVEDIHADIEQLRATLACIPNDGTLRYDDWIKVGYCLKRYHDNDDGKALWLEWSGQFPQPENLADRQDAGRMWDRGLKNPRGTVTYGTLAHFARQANGGQNPAAVQQVLNGRKMDRVMADAAAMPIPQMPQTLPLPAQVVPHQPRLPAFEPLGLVDAASIQKTEFVYADFYARGYTSLTIAAPKVGKSQLALFEAMDMASGGGLSKSMIIARKVLYFNAEDSQNVLLGRYLGNCLRHHLSQNVFNNRLYLQSGVEWPDMVLMLQTMQIKEEVFAHLATFVEHHQIDVIVLDPLQDMSHADETNEAFRLLGQRLRRFASESGVSIHLIHHTRKVEAGRSATIDDARGGSALRGTSRFNRVLVPMTEDEASRAGVGDARYYFRIGDVESNLAPPSSERNQWFEKIGQALPNGEHVGVLQRWRWPNASDRYTTEQMLECINVLESCDLADRRAHAQSPRWFGRIVARIIGFDLPEECQGVEFNRASAPTKEIIRSWLDNGWIKSIEASVQGTNRPVTIYGVGDNDPRT